MDQEIRLVITRLSKTDQKLMSIILFTIEEDKKDWYKKIANLFNKRAEMIELLEDINKTL